MRKLKKHRSSITLQQRLAQLVGARITAFINPFGLIENAKIVKVSKTKSVIVVRQNGASLLIISPLGMPKITVNRRVQKASVRRFSLALNVVVREAEPNQPGTINNRRIVMIGKDFIETTVNSTVSELIPLSNVTVIF